MARSSSGHGKKRRTGRKPYSHHRVNFLHIYVSTQGQAKPRADVGERDGGTPRNWWWGGRVGMCQLVICLA